MNDHAGWTPDGLCVACGSWESSYPCIETTDSMHRKIEILWKKNRNMEAELEELEMDIRSLLLKLEKLNG